jgi:hypothetical protein
MAKNPLSRLFILVALACTASAPLHAQVIDQNLWVTDG